MHGLLDEDATSSSARAASGNDSDSECPIGIYETEETTRELLYTWPMQTATLSQAKPSPPDGLTSFPRHNISNMRGSNPDNIADLSTLFQRNTSNLFGRSLTEAASDLFSQLGRRKVKPTDRTPSLTTDDTISRSPSAEIASHIALPQSLAPLPITPVRTASIEPPVTEARQDTVVLTTPKAAELYDNIQIVQRGSPPRLLDPDELRDPLQPVTISRSLAVSIAPATNNACDWDFSALKTPVNELPPYQAKNVGIPPSNYKPVGKSQRKQKSNKSSGIFKCKHCAVIFTRNFDMLRHIKSVHEAQTKDRILSRTCPCCGMVLSRGDAFKRHIMKVPSSCNRAAKLQGNPPPDKMPLSFYELCRSGNAPLPETWVPPACG